MGRLVRVVCALAAATAGCAHHAPPAQPSVARAPTATTDHRNATVHVATVIAAPAAISADPPPPLACLGRFYDAKPTRDEHGWALSLADGTTVSPEDAREVFELVYPTGPIRPITEVDFDPGRVRIDPLMFATYGKNAKEVQAALVAVRLGGKVFMVHRRIAEPLRRVAARIDAAMKRDPSLAQFFESPGGTFNWRRIAGSEMLSMHSWAIAIDLDTKRANYWHNETTREDAPLTWKNHYPQAIVDAFEAEGFIWGGRWYHFDTMHFEYRPELLDASCYPHA